jgi:hypothetical protein
MLVHVQEHGTDEPHKNLPAAEPLTSRMRKVVIEILMIIVVCEESDKKMRVLVKQTCLLSVLILCVLMCSKSNVQSFSVMPRYNDNMCVAR